MKVVFMGYVNFSYMMLEHLLSIKCADVRVAGIVTREKSASNSDFKSLVPLAHKFNIPYFLAHGNDQAALSAWLNNIPFDIIYCFGWSYLLKENILGLSRRGVIGYHPASLPQNRGRHPIIWALALGLKEIHSTFFFMNAQADEGDIISQKPVCILDSDDATSLYYKLADTAREQIFEFTPRLAKGDVERIPQDPSKAGYWRKRSHRDGEIDWRMSAGSIHNLVRALTRPYPGAHFIHNGEMIKIWKTELLNANGTFKNAEPGKILETDGVAITVKCGEGIVRLIEHECRLPIRTGDYL